MASHPEQRARHKVVDLNPHISCILCGGYFIDATTITECLHSFCRACIVRYLETSKYCPVCEVQVHKTRPLRCIRSDKMLQDIVYKLVPGLYQNEMMRRRELYASQPPEALKESRDEEDRGEGLEHRYLYTSDELFCLALSYRCNETFSSSEAADEDQANVPQCRYLRCPAAVKINHLKKFIRVKYAIPKSFQVTLQSEDEILDDDYSLMDVAYISSWKRNGPIQLTFRVLEKPKVILEPTLISGSADPVGEREKCDAADADAESQDTNLYSVTEEGLISEKSVDSRVCDNVTEVSTVENPVPTDDLKKSEEAPANALAATSITETSEDSKDNEKNESEQPEVKCSNLVEESCPTAISFPSNDTADSEGTMPYTESPKPESKDWDEPPPKVPKLTIPLTPKILQMAALHAEDDRMESDSELFEGRLVIAEPDLSPKESEDNLPNDKDSVQNTPTDDFDESKKDIDVEALDDDEVDSGRGSDSSSRTEARSLFGDDEVDSPESITVRTPDLEKQSSFNLSSPSSIPSPVKSGPDSNMDKDKVSDDLSKASCSTPVLPPTPPASKDDFGVLDLSMCHRKRGEDRLPLCRPKQVANPPVLDKFRQTTPCLPLPDHPSFKNMFPSVLSHPTMYKKPDYPRGNFRFNRSSILTVINPDPNSCRPKIVIKNLDPRPDHKHHHHHHHHHHHGHHHQKM